MIDFIISISISKIIWFHNINPHFMLSNDKLVIILNPSTPNDVKAVVSFIKESLELRKGEQ